MLNHLKNRPIPITVKVAYTLWIVLWATVYTRHIGFHNFLWMCNMANALLLVALLTESRLILSTQAIGVLLVQFVWTLDYLSALLLGIHPIGGTEYMFDGSVPWWLRGISLYHVFVPVILVWGLYRLGYDPRAWKIQTVFAWVLMIVVYTTTAPELNINWLHRPLNLDLGLSPLGVLAVMLLAYPVILFYPSHRLLDWWFNKRRAA